MLPDAADRRAKCRAGLEKLIATRRLIEAAGLPVAVVTGGGTGTWEYVAEYPGVTEIQPGSFLLMDAAYHTVRPEFECSLSIMATVVSRRPGWYVLRPSRRTSACRSSRAGRRTASISWPRSTRACSRTIRG
jgi:D-serine deaminase-like pyridoxal phosphate-dependent protein